GSERTATRAPASRAHLAAITRSSEERLSLTITSVLQPHAIRNSGLIAPAWTEMEFRLRYPSSSTFRFVASGESSITATGVNPRRTERNKAEITRLSAAPLP